MVGDAVGLVANASPPCSPSVSFDTSIPENESDEPMRTMITPARLKSVLNTTKERFLVKDLTLKPPKAKPRQSTASRPRTSLSTP